MMLKDCSVGQKVKYVGYAYIFTEETGTITAILSGTMEFPYPVLVDFKDYFGFEYPCAAYELELAT